jgi:hypothetical protein
MLLIRVLLTRENTRRDKEPPVDGEGDVWVVRETEDGGTVEVKVDKVGFFSFGLVLGWLTGFNRNFWI